MCTSIGSGQSRLVGLGRSPASGGKVRSNLHVLTGATGALTLLSSVPVGGTGNDDFLGYGACVIALADLPGRAISKAIFVTTLNGELAVFGHTNGIVNQTLFRAVVDGSLGAFSSIVIENLEPDIESRPEVYIGGSAGLQRWDFQ